MKYILGLVALFFTTVGGAQKKGRPAGPDLLTDLKKAAREQLVDVYYPRNIDSVHGGYLSTFTYDIRPVGAQDKMIVTQSRHIWTTSKAADFYREARYLPMARHGFLFLRDKMWDSVHGGFHNLVTRDGTVKSNVKEAYGNAFAIYALAAYHKASGDTAALQLARETFRWLEQYSHDSVSGGYYQHLHPDGRRVVRDPATPTTSDLGYKDQNSSIHLLEAFTELYGVWPDSTVRLRLEEMLALIRDTIVQRPGYLQLFFTPDWKPVSFRDSTRASILKHRYLDHVSFGHDVETAFLMAEAAEVLGRPHDASTMAAGKRMVDHALAYGWDKAKGGFFDEGYYFKGAGRLEIIKNSKNWWAQSEALNTLLLFSKLYPSDPMRYRQKFDTLWRYARTYLIDPVHGDWYEEGLDTRPERKTGNKAHIWKATYHSFRALSNCIRMLEGKH